MTKSTMALEAEKAELARIVLALDDMDLVKKVKASIKRITTPKKILSLPTRQTWLISGNLCNRRKTEKLWN